MLEILLLLVVPPLLALRVWRRRAEPVTCTTKIATTMSGHRRLVAVLAAVALVGGMAILGSPQSAAAVTATGFTGSKTVSRAHLVGGVDQTVDTRKVSVTVSDTQQLRDRQGIRVTWSGAHPTGGLVNDVKLRVPPPGRSTRSLHPRVPGTGTLSALPAG